MGLPFTFWQTFSSAASTFDFSVNTANSGTSTSTQFNLPLVNAGAINFVVDWGDGTSDTITSYNQAETLHTYPSSGIFNISISGIVLGWKFNNGGDKDKFLSISNWGEFNVSEDKTFQRCELLTTISATDSPTISSTDLGEMFQNCFLLTNFDVSNWDVINVTDMTSLFQNCDAMTTINCDNWNVGNVEIFRRMFTSANSLVTLNLASWNVSSATNMQLMFGTSNSLTSIGDISSWDVSSVTNMSSTFSCQLLQSVNYTGNWDVSSVVNMSNMFDGNDEINISLANWTITQVLNFYRFMRNSTGLTTANYDATLISWAAQTPSLNESPNFGGSTYTLGGTAEAARNTLINTYGWTITDGGGV